MLLLFLPVLSEPQPFLLPTRFDLVLSPLLICFLPVSSLFSDNPPTPADELLLQCPRSLARPVPQSHFTLGLQTKGEGKTIILYTQHRLTFMYTYLLAGYTIVVASFTSPTRFLWDKGEGKGVEGNRSRGETSVPLSASLHGRWYQFIDEWESILWTQ